MSLSVSIFQSSASLGIFNRSTVYGGTFNAIINFSCGNSNFPPRCQQQNGRESDLNLVNTYKYFYEN